MTLASDLEKLHILRDWNEPDGKRPICMAIHGDDLQRLPVWLKRRPHLKMDQLIILPSENPVETMLSIPKENGKPVICQDPSALAQHEDHDLVMFFPRAPFVVAASMKFPALANRRIFMIGHPADQFSKRSALPGYYRANRETLEKAYATIDQENDREHFARRVKAILTGDPGYLKIAPFFEYDHPEIGPHKDDVMIDGGLSDMVGAQANFANIVGPNGKIFGYEPIPWMASSAAETLSAFPWYHIQCAGLSDRNGSAEFASLRDSSHIGKQAGAETVTCKLATIDSEVRRLGLDRVDCIKLDIEGAELSALKGAENTIRRFKPRLIVCLYHKPADLYEIPLYLKKIAPEYEFRVAHSSAGFTDTILYAQAGSLS